MITGFKTKEYPWEQHDIQIYDLDRNIMEIAEEMSVVIKRFLNQGMSEQEVAEHTMFPLEYVNLYVSG